MPDVRLDVDSLNLDEYRERFGMQRENVSKTIDEYNQRLCDIKEYVNCEIFFNSKRQELLETVHQYIDFVLIMQREIRLRKSLILTQIIDDATTNFNFKSKDEKIIRIEGDPIVAKLQALIDLFNAQIEFLSDSKKGVDNIIFNMKYRFEVQKYLSVIN